GSRVGTTQERRGRQHGQVYVRCQEARVETAHAMTANHPAVPLRSFFSGLAEYAFESRLGIADPPLVDYLAELLARFMRSDAIYAVRSPIGGGRAPRAAK